MTATSSVYGKNHSGASRAVIESMAIIAALLAALIGIYWIENVWIQMLLVMAWTSSLVIALLYLKEHATSKVLLLSMMYLLIASTFLNQALLSISTGFFTLFVYRLLLIGSTVVFLAHAGKIGGFYVQWKSMQVKGTLFFLLFWLAYAGTSLLWSWSVVEGVKYLLLLGIGLLFIFLAVFTFTRVRQMIAFHSIWLLMSTALIVIGLVNHFARMQLPTSTLFGGPEYKQAYPTAVFTNQNDFATLLAISFFFYLAAGRNYRNRLLRFFCFVLAALAIWLIYLTESRASLLGVAAGSAFYLFLMIPEKRKKAVLWTGFIAAAGGLLVLFGKLLEKWQSFWSFTAGYVVNENPDSNSVRVHLLQSSWRYLTESFGMGVGSGNLAVYLENRPILNTDSIFEVHNWLAEITGNFGFLIGAGYLAMYLALFSSLMKMYSLHAGRKTRLLVETCLTAQIAFLISSISPSSVSNLYFHWVFLGFVICTVSVLHQSKQSGES
ncbi:teichuronic acid biosynthesis protein TuaE [Sporolactobacillus nakayamae]|uniref:Teichuronic acid biosynthesis protein TuaE n=1 Tax=Sporolactobacillus nakayamae TaxID=269670 RepID=A0A1I2SVH8_9BACL|nr:O-antigen ligase family protein [Sporolactobacillus nakayamae]SFG56804.1 teichuronic acid biosynthesis protein TuaE [Sporolactobacillus nakayamae]